MAKVGEGDPRWIVQDRADGTNVNNWHWTEKNVAPQARKLLEQLAVGLELYSNVPAAEGDAAASAATAATGSSSSGGGGAVGQATIKGVDTFEGDVLIHVRKGKTLLLYDIESKLKWEGHVVGANGARKEAKGSIELMDCDNVDRTSFRLNVLVDGGVDADKNRLVEAVKSVGVPLVRNKITELLNEMWAEKDRVEAALARRDASKAALTSSGAGVPAGVPAAGGSPASPPPAAAAAAAPTPTPTPTPTTATPSSSSSSAVYTTSVQLTERFRCPAQHLWDLLLDANVCSAFTQSQCSIAPKEVGGKVSMLDGNIQGEITDLQPAKKLVQKWRFSSWPAGHHSQLTLELKEERGETTLLLNQTGVPTSHKEALVDIWKTIFFARMRQMFGL